MSYVITNLSLDRAVESAKKYKYALVYLISDVVLCETDQLNNIIWEECLEARFFSKEGEVHIFEQDGMMNAVEIADDGDEQNTVLKEYVIGNKFSSLGRSVRVKEYLDYDEDGQVYVSLTRLYEIVG